MELNEKLLELRKQKGLTQAELAEILFVSRTAVSKWESGRGYPSIDSLKAIAKFFGVTFEELLSGEELLTIAEEDSRKKENRLRDLVFGSLDCSTAMLFFLPFFGQKTPPVIQAVSLLSLTEAKLYLRTAYVAAVAGIAFLGILTLALQTSQNPIWMKNKHKLSWMLNAAGALLFIISSQPYAAALLFLFLAVKALMLIKWQ